MRNIFSSVKNVLKEYRCSKKYTDDMFKKHKQFLDEGIYRINGSNSMIYNKKFKKMLLQENQFVWAENCKKSRIRNGELIQSVRISSWLLSVFFRKKIKKSEKQLGSGNILVLSTLKNDIKVLNYVDETVYTIFRDANRMNYILEKRNMWKMTGGDKNLVPLLKTDKENLFIQEKLIKKISYDHNDGFTFIFQDITRMFSDGFISSEPYSLPKQTREQIEVYLKSFKNNVAEELLINFNKFINQGFYKKCICHGDLYSNNLLFDGSKFYYIDFECMNYHFFLFDILFYIFLEVFRFDNHVLMENYLNGKYDEQLNHIFHFNHIKYDKHLRKTYLFIVLFEYYGTKIPNSIMMSYILRLK